MIIVVYCKLNRFFRREIRNQSIHFDETLNYVYTNNEFDDFDNDFDNMFAGCAFE